MKIAVTGASGFIGKHLVKALRDRGHFVRELVRKPDVSRTADETVAFDLTERATFDAAVEGVDALVHLAAYLPKNYSDPDEAPRCIDLNALATLDLLRAALHQKLKRFVFFSSNVYRQTETAVVESAATYPVTHAPFYMASKLAGEIWTEHMGRTSALATVSLRIASVYGPGLMRGMIPTFTESLLAKQVVTVKDGGRFRSDLVYVEDVVGAASEAVLRDVRGVFNVGSGTTSSALEVVSAIAGLTNADPSLIKVEPAEDRPVPAGFSPLDIGRARVELDYAPQDVKTALARYVEWHQTMRGA